MIRKLIVGLMLMCSPIIFVTSSQAVQEPPTPIGKVVRIQGWANQAVEGFAPITLKANDPIHKLGTIKTGNDARLEIYFDDGTRMVLGEWAHVTMKDYAYKSSKQPKLQRGNSFVLNFISGTFRIITGFIGKTDKKDVTINTPVATIGIRGTKFFGGPIEAGMPKGEIHYGFMIEEGAIEIKNKHGSVNLDNQFEGTFLPMKGHKAPTPPEEWDRQAVDEAYDSVEFK